MYLHPVLATLGLLLSLGALLITIWIVVPAPSYRTWQLSVGAIEWSLWVGIAGLLGSLLGALALRWGSRRIGPLAIICGLLAMALAAIPPLQAPAVAAQQGVTLSLGRYFLGSRTPRLPLEETRNVLYAEVDGQPLRLDVYRPTAGQNDPNERLPALLMIHGGSWSGGTKGEIATLTRWLARQGLVVFDIDYRLAGPDHRFPAQVADVKCAIGWVKRNAAAYAVDPERVALFGRSAGGQLALLAAYTPNHPALPPSCAADDTAVRAVISFYGPTDLVWGYNNPARRGIYDSSAVLRNYLGDTPASMPERYRLASPHTHVGPTTPPTLIAHGGHDQIVGIQHAHFLQAALERASVPHRVILLPWAEHGFDIAFDGWASQIVQPIMRDFLRTHLSP